MSLATIHRQTNPLYLSFQGVSISVIDRLGRPWVTAQDAGRCLQYSHPETAITRLYNRNKDKFKSNETMEIELKIDVKAYEQVSQSDLPAHEKKAHTRTQKVRVFSMRGLNRLAIYAKTPVADEFHDWILDLIEGKGSNAVLRKEHKKLVDWYFSNPQRQKQKMVHDLFLKQIYSFEEIARRVQIKTQTARSSIKLMNQRGIISDEDYRHGKETARMMLHYWRDNQVLFD